MQQLLRALSSNACITSAVWPSSAELIALGRSPLTLPAELTDEVIINPVKPIDTSMTSGSATSLPTKELASQQSDPSPVSYELVERSICEQLIGAGLGVY